MVFVSGEVARGDLGEAPEHAAAEVGDLFAGGRGFTVRCFLVPHWRVFVPFLLAGVLLNGFSAIAQSATAPRSTVSLNVFGGGFHVGGGGDIYILQWLTLGLRARYRGVFLGKPACDAYDVPCVDPVYQKRTTFRAVTGELMLQLLF